MRRREELLPSWAAAGTWTRLLLRTGLQKSKRCRARWLCCSCQGPDAHSASLSEFSSLPVLFFPTSRLLQTGELSCSREAGVERRKCWLVLSLGSRQVLMLCCWLTQQMKNPLWLVGTRSSCSSSSSSSPSPQTSCHSHAPVLDSKADLVGWLVGEGCSVAWRQQALIE